MRTFSPWLALAGTCDRLALFVKNGRSAVLDTSDRTVIETGPTPELLGRFNWQPTYPGLIAESVHQQAALALGDNVKSIPSLAPVASGGSRTYAVPKQVQATAQRALAAATAPGATAQADPIAVATARSLATGIPVTLPKLRQIARALSIRHTVTPAPAGLANQPGQTAQDATGAVYLLWGGNAARRWANGVINREDARAQNQFAAQALRAAAADAAVAPDDGTAPDTAQDDDLPPTDDMSPDEFNKTMFSGDIVPQEWFQTFYDSIAEGPHGFAASPDRPNLCLYCGAPFYFNIHDVSNRWINEPDKPHFYSESDTDPNICAICNQPPNSELHHIDLSTGIAREPDATAPEPQTLAAYTPYHSIDATPGVLAALMSAEQALESQVQYYAVVAPDDPELAVQMFRNQGDNWSVWSDGIWAAADGAPTEPLQLLDDDTAYSLVRFGLPTSIPAFDLDERALFEAARETLGMGDIVITSDPPDDGVTYQVQMDLFEPNTGLGLSAICGDNTYIWDYGTGTWEPSEFGLPDGTDVAEVSLETAISVAAQLLDHGSADLTGSDGSLMDDIQSLEGTGFNDLPKPDSGYGDDGGGWDEQDDGEDLDDDQIQHLFFMLQDTDDPGLALSLHAHPDLDTWQVWDPQDIAWRPEDAPDLNSLIPSDHTQAAEFAAWQYMAAHGVDTLDAATITAAADRLATTQSAADFVTGYSAVLLYRAPRKMSLHHVESLVAAPAPDVLYTPEERSKNASKQVRDRFGRFAHANSPVQLKSGETGHITSIDPVRKTVTVTDSNGNVHDVPANSVTLIDEPQGKSGGGGGPAIPPLDLNAIPAQPRAGARTAKASLPYLLPPMDKAALDKMFADYQAWVDQQRKNSGG